MQVQPQISGGVGGLSGDSIISQIGKMTKPAQFQHLSDGVVQQVAQLLWNEVARFRTPPLPPLTIEDDKRVCEQVVDKWFAAHLPLLLTLGNITAFLRRFLTSLYLVAVPNHHVEIAHDDPLPPVVSAAIINNITKNKHCRWFFFQTTLFAPSFFRWRFSCGFLLDGKTADEQRLVRTVPCTGSGRRPTPPLTRERTQTTVMMFHPSYLNNKEVMEWLMTLHKGSAVFEHYRFTGWRRTSKFWGTGESKERIVPWDPTNRWAGKPLKEFFDRVVRRYTRFAGGRYGKAVSAWADRVQKELAGVDTERSRVLLC